MTAAEVSWGINLKARTLRALCEAPSRGLITFSRYARVTGMSDADILSIIKEVGT